MKITATITSMLVALTPAVVGQVHVSGSLGTITLYSHHGSATSIFSTTAQTTCETSPFGGPVNATTIEITQRRVPIQCTFYTGHKCSGQNYTLGAGKHDFEKRPLLVDSYKCGKNGTATST